MSTVLTYEDFAPGMSFDCGERTISEAELIAFAREYDMQPMHLDPVAAEKTLLKGLAASGWQTAAVGHRMVCDGLLNRSASYGSPGVTNLRWRRPVRADIPLHTRVSIESVRESKSRPEIGFVTVTTAIEQAGEVVCTHDSTLIMGRRGAGPVGPAGPKPARADESPWADPIAPEEGFRSTSVAETRFGASIDLGTETLTPESIIGFAREYDPQRFHLDEAAGKASLFGGLAASGWHLTALWMRRMLLSRGKAFAVMTDAQVDAVMRRFGPSPGFLELNWLRPALAGDTLRFYSKTLDVTPMKSRPTHGIQRSMNGATNQRGEVVFTHVGQVVIGLD